MSEIEQAMWQAARESLEYLRDHLTELVWPILEEYLALWAKKQSDYGPDNIGLFMAQGCVIRGIDKDMRLKRHYIDGQPMQNESIEDSWMDKVGYGLIGLLCERGLWPKISPEAITGDLAKLYADEARRSDRMGKVEERLDTLERQLKQFVSPFACGEDIRW